MTSGTSKNSFDPDLSPNHEVNRDAAEDGDVEQRVRLERQIA